MKQVINKIGMVLQLVLTAPIKLPGKARNIVQYLALGLGIIESVIDTDDQKTETKDSTQKIDPGQSKESEETAIALMRNDQVAEKLTGQKGAEHENQ
ncbi:MAG: hypothetical protein K0R59_566 [Sphingobacterium sp.]|jgi:hypothetical protein|uniref:hypothetical protein n=1 Tax=Sphingobacterium sp. NGMCC 1.201703 TaxID=3388657 RepID=UPI002A62088E|nr:hypothetical protein [Sphingobacterium sp.]